MCIRDRYRYCEQPFLQALEQKVLNTLSNNELIKIFSGGSLDKISDDQTRKYVGRLLKLGETKLRLHIDSEKLFTDDFFLNYVSQTHNISTAMVGAMRLNEFKEALEGKLIVTVDELKTRLKGSVFVKENNRWNLSLIHISEPTRPY